MDRTIEWMYRAGHTARGGVFVIVGFLALLAALGGAPAEGSKGALGSLLDQPFGWVLLSVMAIGLFAFALWRFIDAAADMENEGDNAKGLAARVGQFASGLTYGGLGLWAVRTVFNRSATDEGGSAESLTRSLMEQPFGGWIVIAAGLVVLGVAGAQALKALGKSATENLRNEPSWAEGLARFGIGARAVVLLIAGLALVFAGIDHNPEKAMGLEDALSWLEKQPLGVFALGAVALGLLSFAGSCLIEARFGQVRKLSGKVGRHTGFSIGH